MKRLLLIGLVLMLAGCAWGRYRSVDVNIRGEGRHEEGHGDERHGLGDHDREHGNNESH